LISRPSKTHVHHELARQSWKERKPDAVKRLVQGESSLARARENSLPPTKVAS